eukprot:Skav215565  [mRNA]  locus=scaffold1793:95347:97702:- [translate_table: standard]
MQAAISSAARIGLIQIPMTAECDGPVEFPTALPAVALLDRICVGKCVALVQLMTPDLAFFCVLVKDSSVPAMEVASIVWFVVGFSLCFGETWCVIGDPRNSWE